MAPVKLVRKSLVLGPSGATQEMQSEGSNCKASTCGTGKYIYIMSRQLPRKGKTQFFIIMHFEENTLK